MLRLVSFSIGDFVLIRLCHTNAHASRTTNCATRKSELAITKPAIFKHVGLELSSEIKEQCHYLHLILNSFHIFIIYRIYSYIVYILVRVGLICKCNYLQCNYNLTVYD